MVLEPVVYLTNMLMGAMHVIIALLIAKLAKQQQLIACLVMETS